MNFNLLKWFVEKWTEIILPTIGGLLASRIEALAIMEQADYQDQLEERARLFVPFSRLNTGHERGHGLGLSIVRHLMDHRNLLFSIQQAQRRLLAAQVFAVRVLRPNPPSRARPALRPATRWCTRSLARGLLSTASLQEVTNR